MGIDRSVKHCCLPTACMTIRRDNTEGGTVVSPRLKLHRSFVSGKWIPLRHDLSLQRRQFTISHCYELCISFLYQQRCCPLPFDSPTLCIIHHVHSPFHHCYCLSSLACSCPTQTRAKRLILARRPGKLSQLSFSPLSESILSNSLPGCRYGHQRAGGTFDLFV